MSGFLFASVLIYMVVVEQDFLPPEGNLGIGVGAGFLVGLITMLVPPVGLFMTGVNLGVAVAAVGLVVVNQFVHLTTKWIPIASVLTVGVFFGILTLRFQKFLTILGTAVIGGAMVMTGLDHFVELSRMAFYVWDCLLATHTSPDPCWISWLVGGCWPLVVLLGVVIQTKVTGVGVTHTLGKVLYI